MAADDSRLAQSIRSDPCLGGESPRSSLLRHAIEKRLTVMPHPELNSSKTESAAYNVTALGRDERHAWHDFLTKSQNGTLFHDLRFLGYHEAGRQDFHHLMCRNKDRIAALWPGAVLRSDGRNVFHSGAGASVGGPVLDSRCRLHESIAIVEALVEYGKQQQWDGITVSLAPPSYNARLAELPSYALARSGFALTNRNVCFVLPLQPKRPGGFADYFRSTAATDVRSTLRKGATVVRGGPEIIDLFIPLFEETYSRHGVRPTHSVADLRRIAELTPEAMRFYVTQQNGKATGGLCVFLLNRRVANVFYICMSDEHRESRGVVVAIADAIDDLSNQEFDWLDLGPSADHRAANDGVVRFKEGLGTEYHLREHWSLAL